MRQPFISPTYIMQDGRKYYYVETDVQVVNLLQRYKLIYGASPFAYYKFTNSIISPEKYERGEERLFLRNPTNLPGWSFQDIGLQVEKSAYCGLEQQRVFNVGQIETERRRFRPDLETTVLVTKLFAQDTTATPELRRAGVVNMGFGGGNTTRRDGGTTDGVGFLSRTSAVQVFDYNASNIQILNAWNLYVEQKSRLGEEVAFRAFGIKIRDAKGEEQEIRTLDQLQRAFPKWFLIGNEILSAGLAQIVGEGGLTQIAGKMYPKSYVGLWQKFAEQGLSEAEVVAELKKQGYTQAQINATRIASGQSAFELRQFAYNAFATGQMNLAPLSGSNNPNDPSGGGSGGSGGAGSGVGGGARSKNGAPWFGPEGYKPGEVQQLTISRSRNIFLSSDEIANIVSYQGAEQVMYQVYVGSVDADGSQSPILTQFKFDFSPNEISYNGFGGEWTSIERNGSFPIIDWKSFKLLQISFSFVIANKPNNGVLTADGLELPVTEQIETLQRMAQAPYPVMFYGFDTLLTNQFRYDSTGRPRGVQFVIQDLSITSQRRNANMEITRAQAQITLQEIPIETTSVIGMPRLKHKPEKPKIPVTTTDPEFGLFTTNLTVQGTNTLSYRT